MSLKLVVFGLAFAAVSAFPTLNNNGYTYTEGVSGNLDTSASGVNYVQTVQPQITTVTTGTKYVQPQVATVKTTSYVQPQVTTVTTGSNYVQPSTSQYIQTAKTNYVQPQVNYVQTSGAQVVGEATNYVQPQINYVQTSGAQVVGEATRTSYVQPQANYIQTSGSQVVGESPSVLISAASVGVPYVKQSGNQVVEQEYNQEIQYSHPIITKNFYTFSGPEEHDQKTAIHHITVGRPQKNYRVIFIKNPSSSANRALIKAHIAPTEEKTVVYVLSKHQNDLDIESEIDEPAPTQPSKPEVVFVKYRTPEEIRHLQETVQTQYNVLGGVNQVSDEGFAPVRSVIGELGGASEIVENTSGSVGIGGGSTYSTGVVGVNSGSVGIGGGSTYTTGTVGVTGGNAYTSASENTNTFSTGASTTYSNGGVQYYENGAAASSPQYTTTTNQQKVYLPPSISSRSDTISDEDQSREISRVIKSTAKLQTLANTEKIQEEENVTTVNEHEDSV